MFTFLILESFSVEVDGFDADEVEAIGFDEDEVDEFEKENGIGKDGIEADDVNS